MPLFEVAILEKPTKNDQEDGHGDRLVMAPRAVIARDAQGAAIAAVRRRRCRKRTPDA